jgi:HSP20 family protein
MNLMHRKANHAWDPFRDFESEMERLFDFPLTNREENRIFDGVWSPAIDLLESRDHFSVKANLPGLSKADIQVSIEDNHLVIKGEKKHQEKKEEKNFTREERFYGSFHRAIVLPSGVDTEKVKASFKNGVLELELPKKEEAKPKQITIDVK